MNREEGHLPNESVNSRQKSPCQMKNGRVLLPLEPVYDTARRIRVSNDPIIGAAVWEKVLPQSEEFACALPRRHPNVDI